MFRTTYSSIQDRYGYNSYSDRESGDEGTILRVNNPIKTDSRVNTVNDILGDVDRDQIKPKMGARIRDDAHHQGRLHIKRFSRPDTKLF